MGVYKHGLWQNGLVWERVWHIISMAWHGVWIYGAFSKASFMYVSPNLHISHHTARHFEALRSYDTTQYCSLLSPNHSLCSCRPASSLPHPTPPPPSYLPILSANATYTPSTPPFPSQPPLPPSSPSPPSHKDDLHAAPRETQQHPNYHA